MMYLTANPPHPGRLMNDMNRMFGRFFEPAGNPQVRGFAADIAELPSGYRIRAELPGFTSSQVDVRIDDRLLIVEAKAAADEKTEADEDLTWTLRETCSGDRKRSFILPENVDKEAVDAQMKDGILVIDLKKRPETTPLSVKVQG